MVSSQARKPVAIFFAVLMLSTHPINAKRMTEEMQRMQTSVDHMTEMQDIATELEEALHEDKMATEEQPWFMKGLEDDCASLKKGLERRAAKIKPTPAKSIRDLAHTLLSSRKMSGALKKAEQLKCSWATDGSLDKSKLKNIEALGAQTPCSNKAKGIMKAAEKKSQDAQAQAFKEATSLMFSGSETCKSTPANAKADRKAALRKKLRRNASVGEDDSYESEAQALEVALAKDAKNSGKPLPPLVHNVMLLQNGSFTEDWASGMLQVADMAQVRLSSGTVSTIEPIITGLFLLVVGFFLLTLVALVCGLATALVMTIIKSILCGIGHAMKSLLRFMQTGHFDGEGFWGSCMENEMTLVEKAGTTAGGFACIIGVGVLFFR